MSLSDFRLHQRCQPQQAGFCFALKQRFNFSMAKAEKTHLALKWATSSCTMLGIKAGSVNFPSRKKIFWQETTLLSDYQHCSSVLSLGNTDQVLELQIRKHKYHFKWTSNSISPWIGNQLTAI